MKNNLKILSSPWFLIGLALLLLNDFIFKEIYGNWLTGKLSDFAGLFIFPLFWTALFPKYKIRIFLFTALFFIFWKSPYSESFIGLWNKVMFFEIARVVDYTDLLALFILPAAYYYEGRKNRVDFIKLNPIIPLLISIFSFIATSMPDRIIEVNKEYSFSFLRDSLEQKIFYLPAIENRWKEEYKIDSTGEYYIGEKYSDSITVKNGIVQLMFPNKDTVWLTVQDNSLSKYENNYDVRIVLNGEIDGSGFELDLLNTRTKGGLFFGSNKVDKSTEEKFINSFETKVVKELNR